MSLGRRFLYRSPTLSPFPEKPRRIERVVDETDVTVAYAEENVAGGVEAGREDERFRGQTVPVD